MKNKLTNKCPLETVECQHFYKWCTYHPIIKHYIYHIPNGGYRNKLEAIKFEREGVRSGVSDYHLPYPAHGYNGLWIEMKRKKKNISNITDNQKEWLRKMRDLGFAIGIAYGADEAILLCENYLQGVFHDKEI